MPAAVIANNAGVANRLRVLAGVAARATPLFRGKTRLLFICDRTLRSFAKRPDPLLVAVAGARFLVTTSELNDRKIAFGIDRALTELIVRLIASEPAVLWDVGANVGAVTLEVAARCPNARLVAIEPSASVGSRLRQNVSLNPSLSSRISIVDAALSSTSADVIFYESGDATNAGTGSLAATFDNDRPRHVQSWAGDDLIRDGRVQPPDIIKVDVEGYEEPVLRGLERHLRRTLCPVIFEHEPYRLNMRGSPPSPVRWLREAGYAIFVLQTTGVLVELLEEAPDRSCDVVALPDHLARTLVRSARTGRPAFAARANG